MPETPGVLERPFLLAREGCAPVLYSLRLGESIRVGRAASCHIIVKSPKVSGHHVELLLSGGPGGPVLAARDSSTNGTGLRAGPSADFEKLGRGQASLLSHGCQLLMPFHTARDEDRSLQERVTVEFPEICPQPAARSQPLPDERGLQQERPLPLPGEGLHAPDGSGAGSTGQINETPEELPDAHSASGGRWRYGERLGEGGLGVVYRAFDMTGGLGTVAVKIAKWPQASHGGRRPSESWQVYIMHREAQWSLQCLHSQASPHYDPQLAPLFMRYLEDHTGFPSYASASDFEAARQLYEAPTVVWRTLAFDPPLPPWPYVVMELAPGLALTKALEPEATLDARERRLIASQATAAVAYLGRFNLIHRDFRGSNVHLSGRGENCRVVVLDLGLTICAEGAQAYNANSAVQASWNRRRPSTPKQYDWVPPEVKNKKQLLNFAEPLHSFDVFSLGVFLLRAHGGKRWARKMLEGDTSVPRWRSSLRARGLDAELLAVMLGPADRRPAPAALLTELQVPAFSFSAACQEALLGVAAIRGVHKRKRQASNPAGREDPDHGDRAQRQRHVRPCLAA